MWHNYCARDKCTFTEKQANRQAWKTLTGYKATLVNQYIRILIFGWSLHAPSFLLLHRYARVPGCM